MNSFEAQVIFPKPAEDSLVERGEEKKGERKEEGRKKYLVPLFMFSQLSHAAENVVVFFCKTAILHLHRFPVLEKTHSILSTVSIQILHLKF